MFYFKHATAKLVERCGRYFYVDQVSKPYSLL